MPFVERSQTAAYKTTVHRRCCRPFKLVLYFHLDALHLVSRQPLGTSAERLQKDVVLTTLAPYFHPI